MFKPTDNLHTDKTDHSLANLLRKKTTSFFDTTEIDKVNKDLPEGVRLTRHKAQSLGELRSRTPTPPKPFQIPLSNRFTVFETEQTQANTQHTTSTPNTNTQTSSIETQSVALGSNDKTVSLDNSFFNNFVTSAEKAWRRITRVEILPIRQPNLNVSENSIEAENNGVSVSPVKNLVPEATNIPVVSEEIVNSLEHSPNSSQIINTSKTSGVYSANRLEKTPEKLNKPKPISPIPIDPIYSPEIVELIKDFNMAVGGAPAMPGFDPSIKKMRLLDRDFEIKNYDTGEVLSHFVNHFNKIKKLREDTNNFLELQIVDLAETLQLVKDFTEDMNKIVRYCIINNIPSKDFECLDASMGQTAVLAEKRLGILRLKEAKEMQQNQPQPQQQQHEQQQNIDQQSIHSHHTQHSQHNVPIIPPLAQIQQQEIQQVQVQQPLVQANAHPLFTIQDKQDLDDLYHQFDAMRARIEELEQEQRLPVTPTQNIGFKKRPPNFNVKPFKGDKKDYLRFKTTFKDMYEDTCLGKTSLALHLGEHLEGEAQQKFAYVVASADENTYEAMWKSMDSIYGTSAEQALEKLDKFTNLPPIRSFNTTTVSMLITTLEEHWVLLKQSLGETFSKENNITFYSFLRKIPMHEVAKYKDYCRTEKILQTFDTFKNWLNYTWEIWKANKERGTLDKALQYWQKGLENPEISEYQLFDLAQNSSRKAVELNNFSSTKLDFDEDGNAVVYCSAPKDETHLILKNGEMTVVDQYVFSSRDFKASRGRGGFNRGNFRKSPQTPYTQRALPAPNNQNCPHCKEQGHLVYKCPAFAKLDIRARLLSVKENNLCMRCLSQGHMARDCGHKFMCNVEGCNRKHHRLIHTNPTNKHFVHLHFLQGLEDDIDSDTESNNNTN